MRYFFILNLLFFFSCKDKTNSTRDYLVSQGNAFGSTFSIQYEYDSDLSEEIKSDLEFFDKLISTYRDDSEIMAFNRSSDGIEADSILIDLVSKCKRFHQISNGYFDPTVAPLSSLYGFENKAITKFPSQEQINEALSYSGLEKVNISQKRLNKTHPKVELNFNAVTGYINDFIVNKFNKKGIKNYLIEIGGEIYAKGVNKDGKLWKVGIDVPENVSENRKIYTTYELNNSGLATSGNYRKFHLLPDGNKVVHTINPKNGLSQPSHLLSATVIAKNTAEADAIATALMAMGLDKAITFSSNSKYRILLIFDDNGELKNKRFNSF